MRRTFLISLAGMMCWFVGRTAAAQDQTRRFEVGAGVSIVRFGDFDPVAESERQQNPAAHRAHRPTWFDQGGSLRLTYHVTRRFALETEGALLLRYAGHGGDEPRGGIKSQIVIGPRFGYRGRSFGVFSKARAGAITVERSPAIIGISQEDYATLTGVGEFEETFAMLDLGGVVDFYAPHRLTFRVDVGDTIIWYRLSPRKLNPEFRRNNLQLVIGTGVRFGPLLTRN